MNHYALTAAILAEAQRTRTTIYSTGTAASLRALSTPEASAPAPLNASELTLLLNRLLPGILAGVGQAREAFGDRKLSGTEAAALATTILGIVSAAVRDGAPLVKGTSAYALVGLIFGVVFDQVVTPLLPLWVRPFAGLIKAGVLRGLEGLYRTVIKRKSVVTP